VAAGQLELTGGAQPIFVFSPNQRKTSIQLLLEAQQHKKYAQTTPLDDGVSSLLLFESVIRVHIMISTHKTFYSTKSDRLKALKIKD
jgi:hypothetical protein